MPYAVVLLFDQDLESQVKKAWEGVAKSAGVPDRMAGMGMRPHLSLAVFDEVKIQSAERALGELALSHRGFEIRLDSVGLFAGSHGVLFLAPAPSRPLLDIHTDCQNAFLGIVEGMSRHYLLNELVFHCTLNIGLDQEELGRATMAAHKTELPLLGQACELALVAFPEVEFLYSCRLN